MFHLSHANKIKMNIIAGIKLGNDEPVIAKKKKSLLLKVDADEINYWQINIDNKFRLGPLYFSVDYRLHANKKPASRRPSHTNSLSLSHC